MRRLLYIFTQAPYSNASGQEGLDAVLVGAAFEQQLSVLFMHDGVYQLKNHQNCQSSELKQFTKAYLALQDFGVENSYIHDLSLSARGVSAEELILDSQIVDTEQVRSLIAEQDKVFTF